MNPVEQFLRNRKRICYGGTAINAILPKEDQFYDFSKELPDYDFFSPNAIEDAKKLADLYYKKGYTEVEAKSGVHVGTYKVFVNFTPVADVTQLDPRVYRRLRKEAISKNGIFYCPPHYLQMSMYLELSRPMGDVSRWQKVFKRLQLLNKHYPIRATNCENDRAADRKAKEDKTPSWRQNLHEELIRLDGIFFGSFAMEHMIPNHESGPKRFVYDILCENTELVGKTLCQTFADQNLTLHTFPEMAEILPARTELRKGGKIVLTLYEPLACHSYTIVTLNGKKIRIATIETMLSFYLAFLYTKKGTANLQRILCLCELLFQIRKKNPIVPKGALQTFSSTCFGKQSTLQSMRAEKTKKFRELRRRPNAKEHERWFLRYVPLEKNTTT